MLTHILALKYFKLVHVIVTPYMEHRFNDKTHWKPNRFDSNRFLLALHLLSLSFSLRSWQSKLLRSCQTWTEIIVVFAVANHRIRLLFMNSLCSANAINARWQMLTNDHHGNSEFHASNETIGNWILAKCSLLDAFDWGRAGINISILQFI